MNNQEKEEIVNSWLAAHRAGSSSPIFEENWWAIEAFIKLPGDDPELAWELILRLIEKENDEKLLAILAAGPIEDLMCEYGEQIIDRVENKAKSNCLFKKCLQGVLLDSNDTPECKRFYEIAGIKPPFDN